LNSAALPIAAFALLMAWWLAQRFVRRRWGRRAVRLSARAPPSWHGWAATLFVLVLLDLALAGAMPEGAPQLLRDCAVLATAAWLWYCSGCALLLVLSRAARAQWQLAGSSRRAERLSAPAP
jgi:hypothetical protein